MFHASWKWAADVIQRYCIQYYLSPPLFVHCLPTISNVGWTPPSHDRPAHCNDATGHQSVFRQWKMNMNLMEAGVACIANLCRVHSMMRIHPVFSLSAKLDTWYLCHTVDYMGNQRANGLDIRSWRKRKLMPNSCQKPILLTTKP